MPIHLIFRPLIEIPIFATQFFVGLLHKLVNRKEIRLQKEELMKLYKEKLVMTNEIERLNKMVCNKEYLELEVNKHLSEGGRLLGIHEFVKKGLEDNPESKDEVFTAYYIFHRPKNSDVFYIRGYMIGEYQPYMSKEPPKGDYTIKHKFRIDGRFRYDDGFERNTCRILIEHVDTEDPYKLLGLARQGFDYLKEIAIEYKARNIFGNLYSGTKEDDGLSFFYRKMGFDLSFDDPDNPTFKMKIFTYI